MVTYYSLIYPNHKEGGSENIMLGSTLIFLVFIFVVVFLITIFVLASKKSINCPVCGNKLKMVTKLIKCPKCKTKLYKDQDGSLKQTESTQ